MKNIAIVTGASSGMGRDYVYAIDREFELDEIWVVARRKERLEELSGKCRTAIRPVQLDLSENESYCRIAEMLEEEKPHISLLVNNAGYGMFGAFNENELSNQLGMIDVNEKALTALCYIAVPYMKSGDSIINMGSNSSWQPVPYIAVYGASKAYVLSFSRAIGRELKKKGIHVMCVCPNWIKTEFMDRAVHDDTVKYYNKWYTSEQVVNRAMKDLRKKKCVSIMGFRIKFQARFLVKHLHHNTVMDIWCRQQGKD